MNKAADLLDKPETTSVGDHLADDLADHARQMMLADDPRLANDIAQIYAGALMVMSATMPRMTEAEATTVIVALTKSIISSIYSARTAISKGH